jgi:hypothetical protein
LSPIWLKDDFNNESLRLSEVLMLNLS